MHFKDDLEYYGTRWNYWSGRIQTNSLLIQSLDMDKLDKEVRRYDEMPWFSLDFFSKAKMFFFDRIGKQREFLCYGSMLSISNLQRPIDEVHMPRLQRAESFLDYHSKHLGFFTGRLKQAAQRCLGYCRILSSTAPQTPSSTNSADIVTEGLTMPTQEQGNKPLRSKGHSDVSEEEAMPLALYRGLGTSSSSRRSQRDGTEGFINIAFYASIVPQVSRELLVQYHALRRINNRILQVEETNRQIIQQGNVLKEELQETKQELQETKQEIQETKQENHKLKEALKEQEEKTKALEKQMEAQSRQMEEMRKMFSSFMNNEGHNHQGSSSDNGEPTPGTGPRFF
ncbi:MAG: hypothetical protein LEGION0403_FIIPPAGN_02494 [Legionella sp.]|uniref:coiled-coil domain-containing protein n=1 Tax=Legionella sp. TaxID=459 RepID=UPI003D13C2ED